MIKMNKMMDLTMMDQLCEPEGEQTSDQGKSNRKNSRGKFGSKIPVKIEDMKYIHEAKIKYMTYDCKTAPN